VDFRETAKTDEQLAAMILNSIPWHRIKGTPASLKAAFALFGLQVEIEEDGVDDYWATYQLGLPQIADVETVKLICRVAYEMQPARCSLYRIYTDVWDVRPGSYSDGRYSEAAYSYYSGVPVPGFPDGGELLVSFGRSSAATALPVLSLLHIGRERSRGAVVHFSEDMQYSIARYSETILPPNHGFVRSRLNSIVIGRPMYWRHTWAGQWDGRRWLDIESVGYAREPFLFGRRGFARIEGVYSESLYGDLNTFYGQPVFTLVDDPPVYGDSFYSEHDPQRRTVLVDEMFCERRGAHADERLMDDSATAVTRITRYGEHQAQAAEPFLPPAPRWNGNWDSRLWRAGGAFANLIHEEQL
jgi:hypothetical protein